MSGTPQAALRPMYCHYFCPAAFLRAFQEPAADVQKLQALFQRVGLGRDRLYVVIQKDAAHSEMWWSERLANALHFLFSQPM